MNRKQKNVLPRKTCEILQLAPPAPNHMQMHRKFVINHGQKTKLFIETCEILQLTPPAPNNIQMQTRTCLIMLMTTSLVQTRSCLSMFDDKVPSANPNLLGYVNDNVPRAHPNLSLSKKPIRVSHTPSMSATHTPCPQQHANAS